MKNVIILLSVFLFLFVAGVGHAGDTSKSKANGNFTFSFNDKGELVNIEPGMGLQNCKKEAEGDVDVIKYFNKLLKDGYTVDAADDSVIILKKNPTCWIFIGGMKVCWCCP